MLRGASAAGDYEIELACRLDIDKESFPWNFKGVEREEVEPCRAAATLASLEMPASRASGITCGHLQESLTSRSRIEAVDQAQPSG